MPIERITSGTIALLFLLNFSHKTLSIFIQTYIFPPQHHIYNYHHRDKVRGRSTIGNFTRRYFDVYNGSCSKINHFFGLCLYPTGTKTVSVVYENSDGRH